MATKEQKERFMAIYQAAVNAGEPHPEIVAAQWAIESSWGKSPSGKNNVFGIKAGKNDAGSLVGTHEVINGKRVAIKDRFKDYNSIDESVADRVNFTKNNPRYKKAGYFDATSPAEAAMALQKAGYATDPNYANSLIDVIESAGLDPYNGQRHDYSTTQPNTNTVFAPTPITAPQSIANTLTSNFAPAETSGGFTDAFNQLNNTLNPFGAVEPETQPNKSQYQNRLAQAFGVSPDTKAGLPDYIGDLVKSIYDPA